MFADVPVSLYTGTAQVQIPMYSFNEDGVSIPIALSYYAAGFRPDMHPGWVGNSWSLSSTYLVSRSVKDEPDDYRNANYTLGANKGYYFNRNVLANANWNQITYMKSIAETDSSLEDSEPDEFSFSYPGGSGNFYLDHTGKWKVRCDEPVIVSFDDTYLDVPITAPVNTAQDLKGNTKSFSGFTITDAHGIQYIFGKTTSAIEYSMNFFAQWDAEWIAQAWYLTKIIMPEGHEINLTYQRDDFVNQMYIGVSNNVRTTVSQSGGSYVNRPECSSTSFNSIYQSYEGMLVAPVYLSNIAGSNTRITFKRSTTNELKFPQSAYNFKDSIFRLSSATAAFLPQLNQTGGTNFQGLSNLKFKKLDSVIVENIASTTPERKFCLLYDTDTTQRLTLVGVSQIGKNGETVPPYLMYYDTREALPGYLANKSDHWGFYNGREATIDNAAYYNTYYALREPDSVHLFAGILNKIISPMGGVTQFVYEPNTYRKRLYERRSLGIDPSYDVNTVAGGLRIRKIINYEINVDSVKTIKEYLYHVGSGTNVSTGVLGGQIKYYFEDYRMIAYSDGSVYSNYQFSSQSALPGCNNAQGSHIGYSIVQEKLSDGGYSKYYFTNFDNGQIDESADTTLQTTRTAYEPYASLEMERGKLYKSEAYSKTNVLLQKTETTYSEINKTNEYVRGLKCGNFNVCPAGTTVKGEEGTAYKIYTFSYLPSKQTLTLYDQDGLNPIVTNKFYFYHPQYRLLIRDSAFDAKGQNIKTYYRYAMDVLGSPPAITVTAATPILYKVSHNMIGDPCEVIQTKTIGGSEQVLASVVKEFANFSGDVEPYKSYAFKYPGTVVLKSSYTNYSVSYSGSTELIAKDSRLELKNVTGSYDAKGNPTDVARDQDVNTAMQWDYNQNFMTAKVLNAYTAPNKQFFYEGFENSNPSGIAAFAGSNCYSGDYTVPYTAPSGRTYKVDYRYFDGTNWLYLSKPYVNSMTLAEGTAIDEVRVYPVDAQMRTYTYDKFCGQTSENDETGRTRLFVFDGLGRTSQVKDENKNILSQVAYNYQLWQPTGSYRCVTCPSNASSISTIGEIQYRDNNPSSSTYNQTRWINDGQSTRCVPPAQWKNTATALRCQKNASNVNTGMREREQQDTNVCSSTFGSTRWVVADSNPTACPIPGTSIKLNDPSTTIGYGTVTFQGTSNSYVFNLLSNASSYTLGSIPAGTYDIIFSMSEPHTVYFNLNYVTYGDNFSASSISITTAPFTIAIN